MNRRWNVSSCLTLLALLPWLAACGGDAPAAADAVHAETADTVPAVLHRELFTAGLPYDTFLDQVGNRVELWRSLSEPGRVPAALVARARAALEGRSWRLLVVAEDACSDSASTIPYIARMAQLAGGLDVRIVDSAAGRPVMEAHPTPDGRAATPTVLLLDERFEEVGCWIERPAALQAWYIEEGASLRSGALADQKAGWYRGDRGRDTMTEIVEMLEAAAAGSVRC
jgi:hypothetical protein